MDGITGGRVLKDRSYRMILLPKRLGSFTLLRKLGTGGVSETYAGTFDAQGGQPVVIRYILPYVQRDRARLDAIENRIRELLGVRHPFLVHVIDHVVDGDDRFVVEEQVDGITLERVLGWCRQTGRTIPHNVFLNIATQICNGLEALHGRTGKGVSGEHVLHLGIKPGAVFLTREGKVLVGSYGLVRSPTHLPHGGVTGPVPTRMEYLSPEQTHIDQKLSPASDIFALGSLLFEMLALENLFRAESSLQTIHRIRRAEVGSQLLRLKTIMPGLDKVLSRALSLNPRHRYQRAFVLREDLRGLMAGYSFSTIHEDTRQFLLPLLQAMEAERAAPPPAAEPAADPAVASAAALAAAALAPAPAALAAALASPAPAAEPAPADPDQEATLREAALPEPSQEATLRYAPDPAPLALSAYLTEGTETTDLQAFVPPAAPAEPLAPARPVEADILAPARPAPPSATAAWLPDGLREALRAEPAPLSAHLPLPPAHPAPTLLPPESAPLRAPEGVSPAVPAVPPASSLAALLPADSEPSGTRFPLTAIPDPSAPDLHPALRPRAHTVPPLSPADPAAAPAPAPAPITPAPPAPIMPAPSIADRRSEPPPPAPRPIRAVDRPAPRPVAEQEPANSGFPLLFVGLAAATAFTVLCLGGGLIWSAQRGGPALPPDAPVAAGTPAGTPPAPPPVAPDSTQAVAPDSTQAVAPPVPPGPETAQVAAELPTPAPVTAAAPPETARATGATPVSATARQTTTRAATPDRAVAPQTVQAVAMAVPQTATGPAGAGPSLDSYAGAAKGGRLSSADAAALEAVPISSPDYTRSRALLLMNAQQRSDDKATRRYLDQLMQLPENQYNPVYLTDQARWYVNHGEYETALKKAELAERYWARLPNDLIFAKKAEIYEIQAAAWQGRFYQNPEKVEYLENAIRCWERYQQHAATRARTDLETRARSEIARLEGVRGRVQ